MTLVNHGFNGSMDEASFAQLMGIEGAEGVDGSAAWAVTQGAGRQVSVAASSGWAAAAGVSSKDDTGAITASLSTPAAGQWYLITRRIDWSAHTCTVVAIAHTTTSTTIPTLPPTTYPTYNLTPGSLYDQPLAWAWVRNTDTTMALFDLRTLPARTRLASLEATLLRNVADLDALVTYDPAALEGRILNVDELNADFQAQDGVWVQITPALFATATARDTAYAKASGFFKVDNVRAYVTADKILYRYNGTAAAWKAWESDWITYTPSLTNIAIGTGGSALLSASYRYELGRVRVRGVATLGTTGSSVSGNPTFDLPVTATAVRHAFQSYPGGSTCYDVSAGLEYVGVVTANNTTVTNFLVLLFGTNGARQGLSASIPFTWTSGDSVSFDFTYDPA
jgi:hypothetical protein